MISHERRRSIERKSQLKKYGLSPEKEREFELRQRGVCAICGKPLNEVKKCTDHIHGTLIVRGILCNHCNLMIGHAFEDPAVLRAGADYLEANGTCRR